MVPEPTISDLLEVINGTFLKLETQINQRFHEVNLRFNSIETRLDRLETEVSINRIQTGSLLQILSKNGVIAHLEAAQVAANTVTNTL